eukprot:14278764-Alexandrium_andersonii.AAC.1
MEVFSPPRLCPKAAELGYRAFVSCDLETGWDFRAPGHRESLMKDILKRGPRVIVLSPPCTAFSQMMDVN